MTISSRKLQRLMGILVMIGGASLFLAARTFPKMEEGYPGPGLFPMGIGMALFVCGVALLAPREFTPEVRPDTTTTPWRLLAGILITAATPPLISAFGLMIVLPVMIGLVGLVMKLSWVRAVLVAALTGALIYLLFVRLMGVAL